MGSSLGLAPMLTAHEPPMLPASPPPPPLVPSSMSCIGIALARFMGSFHVLRRVPGAHN